MAKLFRYGDPRHPDSAAPPCPSCGAPLDLLEVVTSPDGLDEIWDCIADPACLTALRLTWRPRSRKPRVRRVPARTDGEL